MSGVAAETRVQAGAWPTLVRGLRLSPELRRGLGITVAAALVATAGRIVVPVTIQLFLDRGIGTGTSVDLVAVGRFTALALLAVAVTAVAGFVMTDRLRRSTEAALHGLRVRAFRHIHDLSMLHQSAQRRGALVSRVTADVDTISQFMAWGGVMLLISVAQVVLTITVMMIYSWLLTLVVLVTTAPLVLVLRRFQQRLSAAYHLIRLRVADLLTSISESVMAAPVIRAYGVEERTERRVEAAVDAHVDASYRAARVAAVMFSQGEVFAALSTAAVVVVGVVLATTAAGFGGGLSVGQLVAFLFLINLFVQPVQVATEVLDQAQTAIAGWRRILDVLDTEPDVADPESGRRIPEGPIAVRFEGVEFAYPRTDGTGTGGRVLDDVDVEVPAQRRVAIVGETGSGKTTFAKLLTRLMDPTAGRVLLNDVPLDEVSFASLRERVVMVPQEGFLFDDTIAANVRYGRPDADRSDIELAFIELGLGDWLEAMPHGLDTRVGERGEHLSVGERQLVALARAWVANPDLLVLDEATSSVDPVTEARLQRALEGLTRGRTALAIAHRLSTAERADEVLVFDEGRIVERGPHDELVRAGGVYARLHASWAHANA